LPTREPERRPATGFTPCSRRRWDTWRPRPRSSRWDPQALWQAGGATALFIAGFGAAGYATRRDLTPIARASFWALLALIVFGIVLIFVNIPGGALIYSVLGLVIFAGYTMFDFQRIRLSRDISSAPLLAASIFLDILNVFLFFLQIFSREE
jgi:modulator of FtsH protease